MRATRSSNWPTARWRVTFRHVPYDHEAMAALARQNGQPELASALATGRIRIADQRSHKQKRPADAPAVS